MLHELVAGLARYERLQHFEIGPLQRGLDGAFYYLYTEVVNDGETHEVMRLTLGETEWQPVANPVNRGYDNCLSRYAYKAHKLR